MDALKRILGTIGKILVYFLLYSVVIIMIIVLITAIVNIVNGISESSVAAHEKGYNEGSSEVRQAYYQEEYGEEYNDAYQAGYEKGFKVGHREGAASVVALHNPTYQELKEFLARDTTDSNPYIKGKYVCFDFAAEVNNNAELAGIRAAFVDMSLPSSNPPDLRGHCIVAFQTVDRGLVYVEPQEDKEAKPVEGKPYWESTGNQQPRDYDDTVVRIKIIW